MLVGDYPGDEGWVSFGLCVTIFGMVCDLPRDALWTFWESKLSEKDDFENLIGLFDTLEACLKLAYDHFQQKKLQFGQEMFR